MHHGERRCGEVEHQLCGQALAQFGRVHIAVYCGHGWSQGLELGEDLDRQEVAGVHDEVRGSQPAVTRLRQATASAWHVGVGDERYLHLDWRLLRP